jgi:hypothetical protein
MVIVLSTVNRNISVQQDQKDAILAFSLLQHVWSTYLLIIGSSTPTLLAASRHNTCKIYQLLYTQCLLMVIK